ncbi:glutamate synthase-related protein [Methanobacterium alcaliphilum]|uniref:glutamate synthase-related protein n=1 Tax=Methanobacterium alcaliphilum TaxID=392018 RepID=UPI00200A60A4|nr:glutamate synthase-related protein [Methanobacterium alcaliphilum]MCK9151562.1 glutamate synthase-related protein [Methanobacterium alcaliphilum]
MVQILLTDPDSCDGCNDCIEACSKVNGSSAIVLHKMTNGYQAIVCQQCVDPACARGCFKESIYREDGVVKINQDACAGCKLCMLMCPIGSISYTENGMIKCDQQCIVNPGDTPACVSACDSGCLEAVDVDKFATGMRQGFELNGKVSNSSSLSPSSPSSDLAAATQGLCVFCGTCEIVCPTDAIKVVDNHAEIDKTRCIMCGSCLAACPVLIPTGAGSIWDPRTIADIRFTSKAGKYVLRGFGTERKLPSFDDVIILPAQASIAPVDKYRESCNTQVELGTRFAEEPLVLQTPVLIAGMSFGALSKESKLAMAKGTSLVGSCANTGEGGMLPEERELADKLMVQYSSGRFGVSSDYLNIADAIEVKIGQGAKPGMGGHLLAEKVSPEVAEIRGIPLGTDALSPARFLDATKEGDLAKHIELIREVTDWKIPIVVKLGPGRVDEDVKIAAEAGADIISVDGMEGGTGAAPEVVIEHTGVPTLASLVQAVNGLKEIGLKDEVDLIITGGIRSGADVAKAIAMGADAAYIGTGAMIAMGCRACRMCYTGKCPVGVATQDPKLRERMDLELSAMRVANYIKSMTEETKMLAQLAGHNDIRKFSEDDLRVLDINTAAITGLRLIGQ